MAEIAKISAANVITGVVEQVEKYNFRKARKDEPVSESNVEYDTRSLGWKIELADGVTLYIGKEKPPPKFVKGARVKVSVELADEGDKVAGDPKTPKEIVTGALAKAGEPFQPELALAMSGKDDPNRGRETFADDLRRITKSNVHGNNDD